MRHDELYQRNIREIDRLLHIHSALKNKPEFRRSLGVLHKSSIVLLIACWESFIEELVSDSFSFLLSHAATHTTFPVKLLVQASKSFWDSKDERGVWALAGDGWKTVLISHKNQFLEKFHTPRPTQIDKLFEATIGLQNLSSSWRWKNMTNARAKAKLDELMSLRGSIAHKVSAGRSITLDQSIDYGHFLARLGTISSNRVREFVHDQTGEYPWNKMSVIF